MISRLLAVPGLLCMLVLGRGLLSGSLSIPAAGGRGLALMAVLWTLDRAIIPLASDLIGPPERRRDNDDATAAQSSRR